MRLIACITEGTQIRKILDHIGVDSVPPRMGTACVLLDASLIVAMGTAKHRLI